MSQGAGCLSGAFGPPWVGEGRRGGLRLCPSGIFSTNAQRTLRECLHGVLLGSDHCPSLTQACPAADVTELSCTVHMSVPGPVVEGAPVGAWLPLTLSQGATPQGSLSSHGPFPGSRSAHVSLLPFIPQPLPSCSPAPVPTAGCQWPLALKVK